MKFTIKRKTINKDAEEKLLYFQHDRYLSRAHTLIGFSTGLIISLILFFLSDEFGRYFGVGSKRWFIFTVSVASIISVSLAIYTRWKYIRVNIIEDIIDFTE
jgi:hypothetical protein